MNFRGTESTILVTILAGNYLGNALGMTEHLKGKLEFAENC